MSTEPSQSTSATSCSGCTASSRAGPSSHAGSPTSAGPSANTSPNHVHNPRKFIECVALAITKEMKQLPLSVTMDAPVSRLPDVTQSIETYECLTFRTEADPVANNVIEMFPYYRFETTQETMEILNGYLRNDPKQLNEELKDDFHCTDSRAYMYPTLYFVPLCKDQLECGNVSLKSFILAYDNISPIMIHKGALADCSQVEMSFGALPRHLRVKVEMKLEQDHRDPSTF